MNQKNPRHSKTGCRGFSFLIIHKLKFPQVITYRLCIVVCV
nr:MAG TPA: hypothetical protein [Caudoviricetes sp.]